MKRIVKTWSLFIKKYNVKGIKFNDTPKTED